MSTADEMTETLILIEQLTRWIDKLESRIKALEEREYEM